MAGLALLDRLELGDHVCWTVDDDEIRLDAIAGLLAAGLCAHHRVIYCGDGPGGVLTRLVAHGVDIRGPIAAGQLRAETAESNYLADGVFDPEATIEHWAYAKACARADGYRGLRVVGDMTWTLRPSAGTDRLERYEARVNTLFTDRYVMGVCVYDRRLFDPLRLRRITLAHPAAAGPLLPFDPATALRAHRTATPYGVRLSGEADMSNRDALAAVLADAVVHRPDGAVVTVDTSELRFLDTAAARALIRAAADSAGRMRITGCTPTTSRVLRFHGCAAVPGLEVTEGS